MDYLKKLADQIGGKIKAQDIFSSNFKQRSIRGLVVKNYKTFRLQINDFGSLFSIDIKINTDKAFSINKPDLVLFFKESIQLEIIPYPIFVSNINDTLNSRAFQQTSKVMSDLLKKIQLATDEGIFISRNVISFALTPNRDFVVVLDDIFNVLEKNKKIFRRIVPVEINKKNIPGSLKQLIPLLKKYSVSDDVERTQLIEDMSKKKKALLIEAVDPYMDEINNYLSSFDKQPINEEAALMGNLAELVTELKIKE